MKAHFKKYQFTYFNGFFFLLNTYCVFFGIWPAFSAFFAGMGFAATVGSILMTQYHEAKEGLIDAQKVHIAALELSHHLRTFTARNLGDETRQWKPH